MEFSFDDFLADSPYALSCLSLPPNQEVRFRSYLTLFQPLFNFCSIFVQFLSILCLTFVGFRAVHDSLLRWRSSYQADSTEI